MGLDSNKIIEKLQKLIKHEESSRKIGSLAEAEAFANQIEKLLISNKLSMSDIEIKYEETFDQVEQEELHPKSVNEPLTFGNIYWQTSLLRRIASCNNCTTLVSRSSNIQYIIGFSSDRQQVIAIYSYFIKLAQELCDKEISRHKNDNIYLYETMSSSEKRVYTKTWKNSWLDGFAISIGNRLYEEYKKGIDNAQENQQQGLMHLRNKDALVKDFMSLNNYSKKKSAVRSNFNSEAYARGVQVGKEVSTSEKVLDTKEAKNIQ